MLDPFQCFLIERRKLFLMQNKNRKAAAAAATFLWRQITVLP
jgi:hypothetical protein